MRCTTREPCAITCWPWNRGLFGGASEAGPRALVVDPGEVAQLQLATVMRKDAHLADRPVVAAVGEHDLHLAIAPFVAPLAERQDDRQQPLALGRQRIDHAPLVDRIRRALEDATRD